MGEKYESKKRSAVCSNTRSFVRVLFFLLAFAGVFIYLSYLFRPNSVERSGFEGFYAEPHDTIDMVYIGGSVSIVCWAPYVAWAETGIASYTYGMSWCRAELVLPLTREVLKTQSPQLIVFDLRPFQYTTANTMVEKVIRRPADWMPYSCNRSAYITDALSRMPDMTCDGKIPYYLDIIKYHGNWQSLSKDSFQWAIPGIVRCDTKGYLLVIRHKQIDQPSQSDVKEMMPVWEVSEQYLINLLSFLDENHLDALFVVTTYGESPDARK